MRKRKELPLEEIVEKWNNGATQTQLAKEYNVSCSTISKSITEYYNNGSINKNRILKGTGIVVDFLKRGLTVEQIIEIARKNKVIIPESVIKESIEEVQKITKEKIKEER